MVHLGGDGADHHGRRDHHPIHAAGQLLRHEDHPHQGRVEGGGKARPAEHRDQGLAVERRQQGGPAAAQGLPGQVKEIAVAGEADWKMGLWPTTPGTVFKVSSRQ